MNEHKIIEAEPEVAFLGRLKKETTEQHVALEATPLSIALMSPEVSAAQYARYLAAMKEVIEFTEMHLFPLVESVITDIEARQKTFHINSDLHDLRDVLPKQHDEPFHPIKLPVSIPFALGFIYVVEGSTLGGRMILKHLQSKPFLQGGKASQFFTGYGAETGTKWKSFLQAFSAYAIAQHAEQEIIEGAKTGFESIHRHFLSVHA